jgi:hypothetical protein
VAPLLLVPSEKNGDKKREIGSSSGENGAFLAQFRSVETRFHSLQPSGCVSGKCGAAFPGRSRRPETGAKKAR